MIQPYSWILHCVRTLYDQMAEVNSPDNTCIKMIGTSVCYVSFFLLLNPAVHQIAPLAILLTDANIFLLFTRISQGSEVSDR